MIPQTTSITTYDLIRSLTHRIKEATNEDNPERLQSLVHTLDGYIQGLTRINSLTLTDLIQSDNEIIRRNALSIQKQLQKPDNTPHPTT